MRGCGAGAEEELSAPSVALHFQRHLGITQMVSASARGMQTLAVPVEKHAGQYGLTLNVKEVRLVATAIGPERSVHVVGTLQMKVDTTMTLLSGSEKQRQTITSSLKFGIVVL